jgi:hypothetical protein
MLSLETSVGKSSSGSGMEEIAQLLIAQIEEIFQINSSVGELSECSLLWSFTSLMFFCVCL